MKRTWKALRLVERQARSIVELPLGVEMGGGLAVLCALAFLVIFVSPGS